MARNQPYLPKDERGNSIQLPPDSAILATTHDTTISADTELALNSAVKLVEISAISQGIFFKWKTATGGTAVSTTNLSGFVQAGSTRHYVPPEGTTHVSFIEQAASATLVVIQY